MHTLKRITPLALAALAGTVFAAPPAADDGADVQALANQLEQLKSNYAQEVRRLRELDMQVQAMQARLSGRTGSPGPATAAATARQPSMARRCRHRRVARATPARRPRHSRRSRNRGAAWMM